MPGITTTTEEIELEIDPGRGSGAAIHDGGDPGRRDGNSPAYQRASITGITLALGGILMFFLALTSSYIVRRGVTTDWQAFPLPRVLWANTAVLLLSSFTIEMARRALGRGAVAAFRNLWALTSGLGLIFVAGQLLAWRDLRAEGVFLATNPSSSFFYVLTALHGLHLLGGVIALAYVALRSWQGSKVGRATGAEVAAIYWHFMDGLWVFLLLLLTLGR
jgi:cytochrome c oxidase subunit 3